MAERTGVDRHDVAVVLGSGWLPAAERLRRRPAAEVAFAELPGLPRRRRWPATTAPSAPSERRRGPRVLAFLGRVHAYEGHEPRQVVHGVRMAVRAGCAVVVLTNAAGGLRDDIRWASRC